MTVSPINYRQHPLLKNRDEKFQAITQDFIEELQTLSSEQRTQLGLFKAIELTNATIQNLEKDNAPEALGKTRALNLFNIVRAAIRNRSVTLPDKTNISLQDEKLKQLVDRACVMFHAGKNDPEQKAKAIAFSLAQNIVLHREIKDGVEKFKLNYPEFMPPQILKALNDNYLKFSD